MSTLTWDAHPFLEKVLDVVPGVIYVFNQQEQTNEYTNRNMGDLLGYSSEETLALGAGFLARLCHPDDLSGIAAHFERIQGLKDGDVLSVEYRIRHKDGHWVWLLSNDTVFERDDAGAVLRHIGVATDITLQKEAEERALVSRAQAELARVDQTRISEFLALIMNTAKSAIIALSDTGQVLSINAAGRHVLGDTEAPVPFDWPKEAIFVDRDNLQAPEAKKRPMARALAGDVIDGEIFSMAQAGSDDNRYVRLSSAPVYEGPQHIRCVMILDDVSEQEMNRQQVERTSRLDALGQLTGGIAHDFNNLLATVQYALQLIEITEAPQKRLDYVLTARQSLDRGGELTKRLLAFAKQQPGLAASRRVDEIVEEFRALAAPLIESTVALNFRVREAGLWVFCDPAQLGNALLNLVLNARDAILRSGVGSNVTVLVRGIEQLDSDITLRREQPNTYTAKGLRAEQGQIAERGDDTGYRYVEFAVTDNGPGMSEEVKRRAIDPFFTTKASNSGTGLGLSMVYGFIQQAGGELRIYSEPGQGTTIRMLLPRGTPSGAREAPLLQEPLVRGSSERILIVEDETSLLDMTRDLIDSLGYRVDTVATGGEALLRLEEDDGYDLVLTDIVMPGGMDGFQLAAAIRLIRPEMPILYMSGYTGYSDREMGEVVAPLLQKPCPAGELAEAIRAAIPTDP